MNEIFFSMIEIVVKIVVVFAAMMLTVAYMTMVERKVSAFIQVRIGPNRVGPFGLLQPFADGLKLLFKEDILPDQVSRFVFFLAPVISMFVALVTFAVVPFGDTVRLFGREIGLHIADINVGILYVLAMSSLGVYGVVLGGWSSNNKYSLIGGLRSSAQMISYELAMGLSLVGIIMISGTFSLTEIVESQSKIWFVFYQPVAFLIFLICIFAETNRLPFDLPEAESELVGGFHTEYSSMGFALFFLGEYANMITASAMISTLFLGGWQGLPILGKFFIPGVVWFAAKVAFFLFLFVWVRWTIPRFRYDQLMALGWKVLIPLALVNIFVTGFIMLIIG